MLKLLKQQSLFCTASMRWAEHVGCCIVLCKKVDYEAVILMRGRGVRRFFLGTWNMKGFLSEERPIRTLREVLQRLRESYCGQIGYEVSAARHSSAELLRTLIQTCRVFDVSMVQPVACHWGFIHAGALLVAGPQSSVVRVQYMHIPDRERCNWLRERIETPEEVRAPLHSTCSIRSLQYSTCPLLNLSAWAKQSV